MTAGLRGAGVRIAVLDTGFETGLSLFDSATVAAQHDFIFNDSIVRNEAADAPGASSHGTSVWSLLAGYAPGILLGIAPGAEYLLAKTEDVRSETPVEEDNFVAAIEWADSLGADIVTASLGYLTFDGGTGYTFADLNGDIAVTTRAADSAAARGMLVLAANGNGGPGTGTLITPADGDSVQLSPVLLKKADSVLIDSIEQGKDHGNAAGAIRDKVIAESALQEFGDFLNNGLRNLEAAKKLRIFLSSGIGVQDLQIVQAVLMGSDGGL